VSVEVETNQEAVRWSIGEDEPETVSTDDRSDANRDEAPAAPSAQRTPLVMADRCSTSAGNVTPSPAAQEPVRIAALAEDVDLHPFTPSVHRPWAGTGRAQIPWSQHRYRMAPRPECNAGITHPLTANSLSPVYQPGAGQPPELAGAVVPHPGQPLCSLLSDVLPVGQVLGDVRLGRGSCRRRRLPLLRLGHSFLVKSFIDFPSDAVSSGSFRLDRRHNRGGVAVDRSGGERASGS
jgi:hypothetical protein